MATHEFIPNLVTTMGCRLSESDSETLGNVESGKSDQIERNKVKNACLANDACVGYYEQDIYGYKIFMATGKEPDKCANGGPGGTITFHKKVPTHAFKSPEKVSTIGCPLQKFEAGKNVPIALPDSGTEYGADRAIVERECSRNERCYGYYDFALFDPKKPMFMMTGLHPDKCDPSIYKYTDGTKPITFHEKVRQMSVEVGAVAPVQQAVQQAVQQQAVQQPQQQAVQQPQQQAVQQPQQQAVQQAVQQAQQHAVQQAQPPTPLQSKPRRCPQPPPDEGTIWKCVNDNGAENLEKCEYKCKDGYEARWKPDDPLNYAMLGICIVPVIGDKDGFIEPPCVKTVPPPNLSQQASPLPLQGTPPYLSQQAPPLPLQGTPLNLSQQAYPLPLQGTPLNLSQQAYPLPLQGPPLNLSQQAYPLPLQGTPLNLSQQAYPLPMMIGTQIG
jgi:hypothetical protein